MNLATRLLVAVASVAALITAACDPTGIDIPPEDMIVAGVWVVVTVDPSDPARTELLATGWLQWARTGHKPHEVLGASVQVVGASGQSVELVQRPRQESCFKLRPLPAHLRAPVYGTCYLASVSPSPFAPGERVSLTIESPEGGTAEGTTWLPEAFVPESGLASGHRNCLVEPNQNHRFRWSAADGAWAYVGGALVDGLDPRLWPGEDSLYAGEPLHMWGLPIRNNSSEMVFPRDFSTLFTASVDTELAEVLQTGLPRDATADVAVVGIDRNWFNWIRFPTFETLFINSVFTTGEIRIPSIFGAGSGVFGAGVRWTVAVESRAGGMDGDPPSCGPVL